jgi:probable rRNA maturation factor
VDVFLANEQDLPVEETRLAALARHALGAEDIDEHAELSILLVTIGHIKGLNSRFAGNDYPTDVLAFPMLEDDEGSLLLGDVVICPQVADQNAVAGGRSLGDELDVLVVHGTLHLLGYDHQGEKDKEKMERRLLEILGSFGPAGASDP